MDMTNEERAALVELRIEKAVRAYEQAKGVVELKYWETIANRLYYSAYNAVSAVLIANGDTAQTHSGVMHIFGLRFVKPLLRHRRRERIVPVGRGCRGCTACTG